ncbi:MAG: CoB--CoM heterodisulfide reductase iron-sulfur subunit B family protein [Dehalococcoidales bacterium]
MKNYAYFPGCSSSEGTAVAYGLSTQAIAGALGIELTELEDWNCCGSTPYGSANELEAACIAARNLALAEETGLDLVTPCSSCYVTLSKANSLLKQYPELKDKADDCLAAAGLKYKGGVKVRHLFETIYNDIGLEVVKSKVVNPLRGLKVAPYYGCQMIRPECGFDDVRNPQSLEHLIAALGAEPVPFPLKDRCCGGSLIIPEVDIALGLIRKLLESAASNGAQCIVTVCPLCQTALDAYQGIVNRKFRTKYNLPVLFFTQLIGLALGIEPGALALDKSIVSAEAVLSPYTKVAEPALQTGGV